MKYILIKKGQFYSVKNGNLVQTKYLLTILNNLLKQNRAKLLVDNNTELLYKIQ